MMALYYNHVHNIVRIMAQSLLTCLLLELATCSTTIPYASMMQAIHYMHSKGAVHRNIRPATLFVTDSMDIELDNAAPSIVARDLAMRKRTCTE